MTHLLVNRYGKTLYDDNSSYADYSREMKAWTSETMGAVLTKDEDYIYIGQAHTFSVRYCLIDTVNDVSSAMSVEYYYGDSNWRAVKNLEDGTRYGAVTLAQSGFISWDLPTDWIKTQVDSVPELPYNVDSGDDRGMYWIRIKASETLNANTAIRWLGLIWTNEDFLTRRWAEVTNARYLPTGVSDWYETIEMSTGDVADDLNIQNIINYELQAKDIAELAKLTALKPLINILVPMVSSDDLRLMKKDFEIQYTKLLKKRLKGIDTNQNEKLDNVETKPMSNTRMMRY